MIQNMKKKIASIDYIKLFIIVMMISTIIMLITWFFSNAQSLETIIHNNNDDIFMDHFNSLSFFSYINPYDNQIIYPAMTNIIYELFFKFSSLEGDFTSVLYRIDQASMLIFTLFNYVVVICLLDMIALKLKIEGFLKYLFSISILFTLPFIFLIERGNILMLSIVLTSFFVLNYNNTNKKIREISFIALAFAASIKIYPAIFGLLLLKEKRYSESFRLTFYGLLLFVVPFYRYGGLNAIAQMFENIGKTTQIFSFKGLGIQYSFINFIKILSLFLGVWIDKIAGIWTLVLLFTVIFTFFIEKQTWKSLFLLSFLTISIPSFSYMYSLTLMIIPFLFFLKSKTNGKLIYFVLFCLMFINCISGYPTYLNNVVPYEQSYELTYATLIQNMALYLIAISIVGGNFIRIAKAIKRKIKVSTFQSDRRLK